MKILLYCPTYMKDNGELAMQPETQESIDALQVPEGVTLDTWIDEYNPYPVTGDSRNDHENTLMKYRRARIKVLDEGYDALWTVEHDMIVPEDALEKLLNTDAGVVYGLYRFRMERRILNCARDVKSRWMDMSVTYFPELERKGKRQGWLECSGVGMGCTLFRRSVLEKIDFRRPENGSHPAPDVQYAADCLRAGVKQICRFDVPCGHIMPNGKILYPFTKEGDGMYENVKIYVYRTFNANINGKQMHYEEGNEAEMPLESVDDFVRAGYIAVMREPAVKIVNKPVSKAKKSVKKSKPERDEQGRFVSKED